MAEGGYTSYAMYRDEMTETDYSMVNIQSRIIEHNVISLFVRYDVGQDHYIDKQDKPDSLKLYSEVIEITIDDSLYNQQTWYDKWNKEVTYIGVSTMIDIAHLKRGEHILKISTKAEYQESDDNEHPVKYSAEIPFFKDAP